jgi:Protein of unknown function (DUF3987)
MSDEAPGVKPDDDEPHYTTQIFPPRPKTNGASAASSSNYTSEPWPTMAPAAYHGLAGEVVSTILPHTEADPVALLLQYLASFGNVIGRNRYYPVGSTQHFGNLFMLLVGDTSKARKGTSADEIRPVFRICDPDWTSGSVRGGLSSGEGLIHCVRDEVRAMRKNVEEVIDRGVADKRFLALETEFSKSLAVMKREGNTLSQVIRDAWDGRERLETLTKHSPTKASNACISIVGHITREELRRMLDEIAMASGFANRFMFACIRRSKLLPFGGAVVPEAAQRLGETTREALLAAQVTTPVCMNETASELWCQVYSELSKAGDGLLAYITARAEAQTVRLALIYALLDCADAIDLPHLEAALAVWRYCEASARHIFGDLLGDPVADAILQTLRQNKPDGLAKRAIFDLFGRNQSAASLNAALGKLLRIGKVRCEQQASTARGGRPPEMWFAT